jgi:hypothetical protein
LLRPADRSLCQAFPRHHSRAETKSSRLLGINRQKASKTSSSANDGAFSSRAGAITPSRQHPVIEFRGPIPTPPSEEKMDVSSKLAPFRTQTGTRQVTRPQILAAMKEFDLKFRSSEADSGTLYAVEENRKPYPPKRILELATGVPRNLFYGGKPSNDVFVALGFRIVEPGAGGAPKPPDPRLKEPIPDVNRLLEGLFANTWVRLDDDSVKLPDLHYPGVYVLAYPDENLLQRTMKEELTGQPVREEDIFYVGVSHAGVRKRLRQFTDGLEDGGHHSGAKRFFQIVAKRTPYSGFAARKPFFVASVSVPCISKKDDRTALDIRKLGIVAQLEWYVLAQVKEKTHSEPWLNKK